MPVEARRSSSHISTLNEKSLHAGIKACYACPGDRFVQPFSTADLATALAILRWLAQKMAYCLRPMEAIQVAGKQGNAVTDNRAA